LSYPGPVVSAQWLHQNLETPGVVVVDATVHLPDTGRDARKEYLAEHIPGALFFDFEQIADPDNPLRRKIPSAERFAEQVGALGIDNQTHVVAYDTPGLYSAARVWWLFRHFGYDSVTVLNGGLKAWKAERLPVDGRQVKPIPAKFVTKTGRNLVAFWPDVLQAIQSRQNHILDARTPGRWAGTEVDRYPGARPGHIPGSRNLYWADLLDAQTRKLLPVDIIRQRLANAGVRDDRSTILSCGSGLTACILALGMHLAGNDHWRVYDGSWDEWGRRADLPVEASGAVT